MRSFLIVLALSAAFPLVVLAEMEKVTITTPTTGGGR
jgi:hypothetical protein